MTMHRTLVANSLLIGISLILALAVSEGLVRAFDLAPEIVYVEKWRVRLSDNPIIGYEPIPNLVGKDLSVQYYGYRGASNNMGYRDYDHPLKKQAGTQRILVIGDSLTAGLWINADEQVFTHILEKRLNRDGIASDVMNFGVSGYNTRQEVETLRAKGIQFEPDLVILAYCLNDRSQDDGNILGLLLAEERQTAKNNTLSQVRLHPLVKNSALLRMITYKVIPSFISGQHVAPSEAQRVVDNFYKDTVEDSLEKLAKLSEQHGFEVLLAVFPDFGEKDRGLEGDYAYTEEHQTMAQLAKQHQFHHLDLLPSMRLCKKNAPKGYTVSYDRYHPNPIGSRCVGEALAEKVAAMWAGRTLP